MNNFAGGVIILLTLAFGVSLTMNDPKDCTGTVTAAYVEGYRVGILETTEAFKQTWGLSQ